MTVVLQEACPPMREVVQLGKAAAAVYGVLWEAAWHDKEWQDGSLFGGTTELSHKALADICHLGKATVVQATDDLLDAGFISVIGLKPTPKGSCKRVYRVIHPDQLEAQRWAISFFDEPPSQRAKKRTHSPADAFA